MLTIVENVKSLFCEKKPVEPTKYEKLKQEFDEVNYQCHLAEKNLSFTSAEYQDHAILHLASLKSYRDSLIREMRQEHNISKVTNIN